ncbi:MAG: prepilin peptidase [Candidatus Margulisbacteria bacterium]|nr:prepilin peptidase [Candidatus Margulisiibacteriota bacterium]
MNVPDIILFFVLGAVLGSFINMAVYRLLQNKSLFASRSYCDHCEQKLGLTDLIPILGFVLNKGRCRFCQKMLSWYYPWIEFGFGLLTLYIFSQYHLSLLFILWLIFFLLLIIITLTDFLAMQVYNQTLYPLLLIALLLSFISGNFFWQIISAASLTLIIFLSAFILGRFLKKEAMGDGDYFILFSMTLLLSLEKTVLLLFLSSFIGILLSLVLKKKTLPFVPLLSCTFLILFIWR